MDFPLRYAPSIIFRPFSTWRRVASGHVSLVALTFGYVLPLDLIGPVATYLARRVVGLRIDHVVYRASRAEALGQAAFAFGLALAGVFLVAALVDLLAPAFGARRNFGNAYRVAAFAYTPVWLAAVLVLAPRFGVVEFGAIAYEVFLLYAGLAEVMGVPRGKAGGLAACAVLGTFLIAVGFGELSAFLVRDGG